MILKPGLKSISRRRFLKSSAILSASAAAAALPSWMPRFAFKPADAVQSGARSDVLISIFLRGGADALNIVVPHGDDYYYAARPQIAIPRPDTAGDGLKAIDIDGFFGLHPSLAPLLPIIQNKQMIAIHGTGSPHGSRSHFEAMDFMERGTPGSYGLATGWIGRHLATVDNGSTSPLRAVGFGASAQTTLQGPVTPIALRSIVDYHLGGNEAAAQRMAEALNNLYTMEGSSPERDESLMASAVASLEAIELLESVRYNTYVPQNGAVYPERDLGRALRQTAALIRADVGLEAVCIDLGGWDTHANQGGVEGVFSATTSVLAEAIAAFHTDMQTEMDRISLVVMSEFGRRVAENRSAGTDHGTGGAMWVMSGGILEEVPPVVARWRGLAPELLERGEDVPITIDYRDVLTGLIQRRLKNDRIDAIFPDYTPQPLRLFAR